MKAFRVTLKQSIKKEIQGENLTPESALEQAIAQVNAADTKFEAESYSVKEIDVE